MEALAAGAMAGLGITRFFINEDDCPGLDVRAACLRLGRALSIPTLSSYAGAAAPDGSRPFDTFIAFLRESFPCTFAAARCDRVGDSLLLTLPGSNAALPALLLMGHMDVVPVVPGTEGDWTHGAFEGVVDEAFIWGRGAVDMKSHTVGILEATEYVLSHGERLGRTLCLAFGEDEETDQFGAARLAALLAEREANIGFLVDEGDYRIVDTAEYRRPGSWVMHADLAEKGYADVVLRVRSAGGHSANPFGGTSLETISRAIAAVCDIEWPVRLTPLCAQTLLQVGLATSEQVELDPDGVARSCVDDPQLFPLVTTTCAPTMIEGGSTACNVMPQDMMASINFRMLEGVSVGEVFERCREAIVRAGLPVEVELAAASSEPTVPRVVDGPGLAAVRRAAARYFAEPSADGGAPRRPIRLIPSMVTGATDAANYERICPECIRFSPFVVDDEECDRGVHGTNERISRRAYAQGIRFFIRLIEQTCCR